MIIDVLIFGKTTPAGLASHPTNSLKTQIRLRTTQVMNEAVNHSLNKSMFFEPLVHRLLEHSQTSGETQTQGLK